MRPYGIGILRGMLLTLGHFVRTYSEDARRALGARAGGKRGPGARGIFTVQYPEERVPVPERFRVLPILLYDGETGEPRCTACGICAKVCPPQCIWISQARGTDGKPRNKPEEFSIEPDVCMNCGLCAEHCPFGSIKMDHRFELAVRARLRGEALTMPDLLVSTEYWAKTHPKAWAEEEAKRSAAVAKPK
jgi:NADH-quinone oxidoreductase subunit I